MNQNGKARLLKTTILELIQDIKNSILKDPWDKIEFGTICQVLYTLDQDNLFFKIKEKITPELHKIYSVQVQNKNEDFFLKDNTIVFKKKDFLKKLWINASKEDKEVLWSYFSTIIKLLS